MFLRQHTAGYEGRLLGHQCFTPLGGAAQRRAGFQQLRAKRQAWLRTRRTLSLPVFDVAKTLPLLGTLWVQSTPMHAAAARHQLVSSAPLAAVRSTLPTFYPTWRRRRSR